MQELVTFEQAVRLKRTGELSEELKKALNDLIVRKLDDVDDLVKAHPGASRHMIRCALIASGWTIQERTVSYEVNVYRYWICKPRN